MSIIGIIAIPSNGLMTSSLLILSVIKHIDLITHMSKQKGAS